MKVQQILFLEFWIKSHGNKILNYLFFNRATQ